MNKINIVLDIDGDYTIGDQNALYDAQDALQERGDTRPMTRVFCRILKIEGVEEQDEKKAVIESWKLSELKEIFEAIQKATEERTNPVVAEKN